MHLLQVRIVGVGPFDDVSLPFFADDGGPRAVTVIHGGGGVGKTTLLGAVAATRPGHCVAQPAREEGPSSGRVVCDYHLADDEAERPHPLRIQTPSLRPSDDDETTLLQRREQALFDKRARQGGFVFVGLPAMRWFSRQPLALHAPGRTLARWDVRAPQGFDDASRADLARDTKQALAYAALGAALPPVSARPNLDALGEAMTEAVAPLVELGGHRYLGLDPPSFEPLFEDGRGRLLTFDALPTRVRHLVAFAALPTRALWAAYPGRDPRACSGIVAIDEVDAHQDPATQAQLVSVLVSALPGVQWLLTATSPVLAGACDAREVVALRTLPGSERVEVFHGEAARTH